MEVNRYYSITKRMMLLAGQWPYQDRRTKLFRVSLLTVITISLILPQVGKFIQCDGDMQCIFLTIPVCMLMLMILVKMYTCHFNSSKIKNLTDYLHSDWEKLENAEEYEIMKKYAAKARLLSLVYCLYTYITSATFVSICLMPHILNVVLPLNESRPIFMPYEAYYFVDGEKYFFYIFFHVLVSVEIVLAAINAHDCMLLVYIEHVCSIFAVAGFRFGTVSCYVPDDAVNNSQDDVYHRKIAVSVHAHWRALRFAELFESTFCVAFAVQLMIVTVAMSISLLQVALQMDHLIEGSRYIIFVIAQLIHLFCYSLQGQRLIDHSEQLRDKIYNSSWYNIPARSQRLLLYVLQRSMQPNFLTAGKIYVFSMKSFTTVGKFIQCDGDVQCILLTIPACMLMLMILVKLYTCHFNNNKIKDLTDYLRNDWEKLENAEEYEIMKTYAANARLFSLAYCLYYYIASSMFISISLIPHILNAVLPLNESRPILMPYETYYFVDGEKYFFYIFFHSLVCLEIAMTAIVAHDCMLLVYIEHVCSVFAVAGFRFGILSRYDPNDAMNNSLDNMYDRKIGGSVHAHWRALRFAELLENTFCIAFAIQIMIVTVTMSVSLLQLALQFNEVAEAMRYSAFVFSQLIHLFCYSLQGQKLIDHSMQLRDKIYNSSWYNIPTRSQRLLLYVMQRSMQPNFLSAGKIYVFSLKSYTTVVQSSVSYFTVLASFQ